MSQDLANLEHALKEFIGATQESLSWEWDSRFLLMLSVLEARHREDVEPLLDQCFDHRWSHDTPDIPSAARDILGGIGGLRPRQFLLTTPADTDPVLFCAWWPWGGGGRISLRIGCWSASIQGAARDELRDSFKGWFV